MGKKRSIHYGNTEQIGELLEEVKKATEDIAAAAGTCGGEATMDARKRAVNDLIEEAYGRFVEMAHMKLNKRPFLRRRGRVEAEDVVQDALLKRVFNRKAVEEDILMRRPDLLDDPKKFVRYIGQYIERSLLDFVRKYAGEDGLKRPRNKEQNPRNSEQIAFIGKLVTNGRLGEERVLPESPGQGRQRKSLPIAVSDLQQLSELERKVIQLRVIDGVRRKDAAEALNISEKTVYRYYTQALAKLKKIAEQ